MHTFQVADYTVHHNGDFSGDVHLIKRPEDREAVIPYKVLEAVVVEKVRADRIAALEDAGSEGVLGYSNA